MGIKLRSFRPAGVPSFTLPYREARGYGGFGDVLLPETGPDAQVIAAWQQFGAPAVQETPTPASTPATTTNRRVPPPPTTSTTTQPPWDPAAC